MSRLEAAREALTQYAIDHHALGATFDPGTGVYWILLPQGSDPTPPSTELPVRITIARYSTAQYDAAVADLTAASWAPDARKYTYSFGLDAETGTVAVDTTAPPTITSVLAARHPGIIAFRPVTGLRRVVG